MICSKTGALFREQASEYLQVTFKLILLLARTPTSTDDLRNTWQSNYKNKDKRDHAPYIASWRKDNVAFWFYSISPVGIV